MTPSASDERLLVSTPQAPWLPPGSTAEVWVGEQCTGFDPAVIARLAVWRASEGGLAFLCVPSAKGLDLPTRFLGSGADRESVREGVAKLSEDVFGRAVTPDRCIGYVRNVVPHPDGSYPHPTPHAHVPVFSISSGEPTVDGGEAMMRARLGLGLIGIGRPWPSPERPVPSESQVIELLETAVTARIRFFDTAPAYGDSERRLGQFLQSLTPSERDQLTIATKCGERWDPETGSVTTHAPAQLAASVEQSVSHLGRIDVLQLHQASADVLQDEAVLTALRTLQSRHGIAHLGVSVKTADACDAAARAGLFTLLQMPINHLAAPTREWAVANNRTVSIIGNRPFASGRQLDDRAQAIRDAADAVGHGVVLTGTTNPRHLLETVADWKGDRRLTREVRPQVGGAAPTRPTASRTRWPHVRRPPRAAAPPEPRRSAPG